MLWFVTQLSGRPILRSGMYMSGRPILAISVGLASCFIGSAELLTEPIERCGSLI